VNNICSKRTINNLGVVLEIQWGIWKHLLDLAAVHLPSCLELPQQLLWSLLQIYHIRQTAQGIQCTNVPDATANVYVFYLVKAKPTISYFVCSTCLMFTQKHTGQ